MPDFWKIAGNIFIYLGSFMLFYLIYTLSKNMVKAEGKIKTALLCIGTSLFIGWYSSISLGTHIEGTEDNYEIIKDYHPKPKQQWEYGITVFLIFIIPSAFGYFSKNKDIKKGSD